MNCEYEDLGNGLSLPCIHMDLTHAPVENLKSEIFQIIDKEGGLLFRDAGLFTPKKYSEFFDICLEICVTTKIENMEVKAGINLASSILYTKKEKKILTK